MKGIKKLWSMLLALFAGEQDTARKKRSAARLALLQLAESLYDASEIMLAARAVDVHRRLAGIGDARAVKLSFDEISRLRALGIDMRLCADYIRQVVANRSAEPHAFMELVVLANSRYIKLMTALYERVFGGLGALPTPAQNYLEVEYLLSIRHPADLAPLVRDLRGY